MPVAHCISSTAGVILSVDRNFCRMLRRSEDELIGVSYKAITAPDDLRKSADMLHNLVDRAGPTRLTKRYMRPDGSLVAAELLVSKFDDDGKLVSTLSWTEHRAAVVVPANLWKAALQIKHLFEVRIAELGPDLFSDHVALILLSAYLAEAEGQVASVASIARDIGLSRLSTDRWIKALEQRSLFEVIDAENACVQLTEQGASKLERIFNVALHSRLVE